MNNSLITHDMSLHEINIVSVIYLSFIKLAGLTGEASLRLPGNCHSTISFSLALPNTEAEIFHLDGSRGDCFAFGSD